jgi:hypothetical protein
MKKYVELCCVTPCIKTIWNSDKNNSDFKMKAEGM